jgi:23S rRNA pseudouridine2605 synthase
VPRAHPAGVLSLPRALSRAGVLTREEGRRAVLAGRVTVGGAVERDPRRRVDPSRDEVRLDGAPLPPPPAPGESPIFALNKPRGTVVTRSDPEGRPTAFDLLPRDRGLLRFVGRLDRASAGLLLATADTRLAAALEDPERGVPRTYRVKVHPRPDARALEALRRGVPLDGVPCRVLSVEVEREGPRSAWLRVALPEGRNREVRRMAAATGLEVEHLVRVAYGPVALGDLAPGSWRELSREEADALRRAAAGGAPPRPGGVRGSPPTGTSRR